VASGRAAGPSLPASAEAELRERARVAAERARRLGRPVLASLTVPLDPGLDVTACVFASRRADERYFVWEQPDRDRFALAGLGAALTVEGIAGANRFAAAGGRCAEALRDMVGEPGGTQRGAGPAWTGGFAFDPEGGATPEWATLPPALLVLPELSLVREAEQASATVNVVCRPGDDPAGAAERSLARLAGLRVDPMPLRDPDPSGGFELVSALPPEHYVEAVARARDLIRAGELEKAVLAREVRVEGSVPFHPASVFDSLRAAYPSCFCFCVGTPDVAFVGASPELLVRRDGAGVATVAMAGSTRRSADPAVDDHLGQRMLRDPKERAEHAIVARRIERQLAPLAVWVAAESEPSLIKVANIQHLATPVRAQLAQPLSALELAGALHPTPALGGEPWGRAREAVKLERLDRGWYGGPVGWMDATEDGELCVAIRCALLAGRTAHCYSGVGVVADSDPEAELAETEVKLQAVLPALIGA
jgi:salicylate biosynthesis isochorismate synthase/menaquinone-specific isochorismate synthase